MITITIKLLVGLFFVLMGCGYLYTPHLISKFNRWVRDNLATDRLLILHRRKAGIFFIIFGAILLYLFFN